MTNAAVLSDDQIKYFASQAGFSGNNLNIAVAVALAESGGNPSAHNNNATTGDDSYGLWQINMIDTLGPSRAQALGITSYSALFDPALNAKAAMMIYKSQGWPGWSTYKRGDQKKFLARAQAAKAINSVGNNPVQEDTKVTRDDATPGLGVSNPLSSVQAAIADFGSKFQTFGLDTVASIVAVALLILGVVLLMHNNVKSAVKTVGMVL